MLSDKSMIFIEHLATLYKESGINEFDFCSYFQIPNYEIAIQELLDKGYLNQKNNILGTLSINFDAFRD